MQLKNKIESLLFVSAKPLSLKKLAEVLKASEEETDKAARELILDYDQRGGGVVLVRDKKSLQMMTNPDCAGIAKDFLHSEMTGELTRPSLETLTIIAYRQPVSKAEIEMIRGINCSLILRNLLIRGLVEETDDENGIVRYSLTLDFMQYLGIKEIGELPDFERLNKNISLNELLEQNKKADEV